jgi:transcription antitermination factor NusG
MPAETDSGDAARHWYAVYTKSRHEKVVHAALEGQGVEAFLPLHDVLSRWKDRRKWVAKPLFPGYLFVRLPRADLWVASAARGAVSVVGDGNSPVVVPDQQVESVRELVARPVEVAPWPYLKVGQLVIVKSGALMGLQGFFVSRKGKSKLVISVELLGRSVAAEVDADCVEPIKESLAATLKP